MYLGYVKPRASPSAQDSSTRSSSRREANVVSTYYCTYTYNNQHICTLAAGLLMMLLIRTSSAFLLQQQLVRVGEGSGGYVLHKKSARTPVSLCRSSIVGELPTLIAPFHRLSPCVLSRVGVLCAPTDSLLSVALSLPALPPF